MGAQKAGTTWLGRYLGASPEFRRGFRKEYHVLDAHHLASERWLRDHLVAGARTSLDEVDEGAPGPRAGRLLLRAAMVADLRIYFDHFASLVDRDDVVRATGDLSPEHALLHTDHLVGVRDGFAERGLRTAAIFLMRDPVDRVWSQIRMRAAYTQHGSAGSSIDELRSDHAVERFAARTRYHETLRRMGEAFPVDDVFVGLFETMIADPGVSASVSDLVGITRRVPRALSTPSNTSPRDVATVPDDVARVVARHYAETYREVDRLRPDLEVARHWPHARWVLG